MFMYDEVIGFGAQVRESGPQKLHARLCAFEERAVAQGCLPSHLERASAIRVNTLQR
jgi:hypothetical protein